MHETFDEVVDEFQFTLRPESSILCLRWGDYHSGAHGPHLAYEGVATHADRVAYRAHRNAACIRGLNPPVSRSGINALAVLAFIFSRKQCSLPPILVNSGSGKVVSSGVFTIGWGRLLEPVVVAVIPVIAILLRQCFVERLKVGVARG